MGAIPALMLTAAMTTQYAYPVDDVLTELKTVCFKNGSDPENPGQEPDVAATTSYWARTAEKAGWVEISSGTVERSDTDRFAIARIGILNGALFNNVVEESRFVKPAKPMLGGQVFRKVVAGRTLYLSIFGYDEGSDIVGECRIHDFLGDGISKDPIKEENVRKITTGKVTKSKGPFGSDRYRWPFTQGQISELDVHFGFGGWGISPFSDKVRDFDPYAPYGLTLVAGFHEQIIVV